MSHLEQFSVEELLTACLWAEARGEPEDGQYAVCNVIINRVNKRMRSNIRDVILQPFQFSWTTPADVNYQKVFSASIHESQHWGRAQRIAHTALTQGLSDNTYNADHYLNVELTKRTQGQLPVWASRGIRNGQVTVIIGNHTFFNLLGPWMGSSPSVQGLTAV